MFAIEGQSEMNSQQERAERFRALHQREGAFVIPNPWDRGTARLLAHAGFDALATTSAGCAFSLGKPDGAIGRDAAIRHAEEMSTATELPVSGDLENGFGPEPETVAETIRLAARAGLVGGSIEDATSDPAQPIFEFDLAVERVAAAAKAARSLPFPFMLTARAENYLYGRADLRDTIRRLQAYQQAGADVLYAPGLRTREDIEAVVQAVDRPVNVLAGLRGAPFTVAELSAIGVKRISVGSGLNRAAFAVVIAAAQEMRECGTFSFGETAPAGKDFDAIFRGWI